jgi:bifunctional non-homologous end joining protein LigD
LLPKEARDLDVTVDGRSLRLTNLQKPFWPEEGLTKGDLLRYYVDISHFLLPHLVGRAMVMKRYPNGATGEFFFQKRAPVPRPEWIETCSIEHASASVIDFPIVRDLSSLLWIVNLGCIDLNPWYARCDDVDRPDFLHFDLDPVEGADFDDVLQTALLVRDASLHGHACVSETTGSRASTFTSRFSRPSSKEVWTFARSSR